MAKIKLESYNNSQKIKSDLEIIESALNILDAKIISSASDKMIRNIDIVVKYNVYEIVNGEKKFVVDKSKVVFVPKYNEAGDETDEKVPYLKNKDGFIYPIKGKLNSINEYQLVKYHVGTKEVTKTFTKRFENFEEAKEALWR